MFLAICDSAFTCFDICSETCFQKEGTLSRKCMMDCPCHCDQTCKEVCDEYDLGTNCMHKCGCFEDEDFGIIVPLFQIIFFPV